MHHLCSNGRGHGRPHDAVRPDILQLAATSGRMRLPMSPHPAAAAAAVDRHDHLPSATFAAVSDDDVAAGGAWDVLPGSRILLTTLRRRRELPLPAAVPQPPGPSPAQPHYAVLPLLLQ